MTKNVGKKDKTIRIVLGVVFLILGPTVSPWFYLLAVIAFATALMGWCPLHRLFGINTCAVKPEAGEAAAEEVYKCQGTCGGQSNVAGTCQAEVCTHHGQPLVKE